MESKSLELQRFGKNAAVDDIVAALRRDGAAVVENLAGESIVDELKGDLREPFDTLGRETENDFNGYKTLRINSVLELSRASAHLIGHAKAMAVMDAILLEEKISVGSKVGFVYDPFNLKATKGWNVPSQVKSGEILAATSPIPMTFLEDVELDSAQTNGFDSSASACTGAATTRAIGSGNSWPMRFGTSSPMTIEKYVMTSTTIAVAR